MKVRAAIAADADGISAFLQELAAIGKRSLPSDRDYVLSAYIKAPTRLQCSVAEDEDGTLLGLQILKIAEPGNPYDVTPGWAVIGTHVSPQAARKGVGRALFAESLRVAGEKGVEKIDATIGAANEEGLAYYEKVGFRAYRQLDGKVCKCFDVTSN